MSTLLQNATLEYQAFCKKAKRMEALLTSIQDGSTFFIPPEHKDAPLDYLLATEDAQSAYIPLGCEHGSDIVAVYEDVAKTKLHIMKRNPNCDGVIRSYERGCSPFYNKGICEVTIDRGITFIGDHLFENNNISILHLPDTIGIIGLEAFSGNALREIVIPHAVQEIRGSAFKKNELTSVVLHNALKVIGSRAFCDNRLTAIKLPESLVHIGSFAFSGNLLKAIKIPNSIHEIKKYCFEDNLLEAVKFPEHTTTIDDYAFAGNRLATINLPYHVTHIGKGAFDRNVHFLTINVKRDPNTIVGFPWKKYYGVTVNWKGKT